MHAKRVILVVTFLNSLAGHIHIVFILYKYRLREVRDLKQNMGNARTFICQFSKQSTKAGGMRFEFGSNTVKEYSS